MAPTGLIHRPTKPTTTTASKDSKPSSKAAMAKRGLRSLAIAVSLPLSLTLSTALLLPPDVSPASRPFWLPPRWAFHAGSACTSSLMGLAAWMVWAEGGFRREPAAALLYLSQLVLGVTWAMLVFGAGAAKAGMVACVSALMATAGCAEVFARVSPVAASFARPCMAWILFFAFFNFKLV